MLSHIETRRQAVGAGLRAGAIGIVPGNFVFISMLARGWSANFRVVEIREAMSAELGLD